MTGKELVVPLMGPGMRLLKEGKEGGGQVTATVVFELEVKPGGDGLLSDESPMPPSESPAGLHAQMSGEFKR